MSKLKPCPFCGGEAWSYSEDDGWNHLGENCYRAEVRCESCGAMFELHHHGDDLYTDEDDTPKGIRCHKLEEQAAGLWNSRTIDRDALLALADELDEKASRIIGASRSARFSGYGPSMIEAKHDAYEWRCMAARIREALGEPAS